MSRRILSRRKQIAHAREKRQTIGSFMTLAIGAVMTVMFVWSLILAETTEQQAMERLKKNHVEEARSTGTTTGFIRDLHAKSPVEGSSQRTRAGARVGFDTLAGYPFKLSKGAYNGGPNVSDASSITTAQIPEAILALNGRSIAIQGFMLPLKVADGRTTEWLLMRDRSLCCFGATPRMNEWILVHANEGIKPAMDQPVTCMGTLHVGEMREDGFLVGIYRMDATAVTLPK